MQAPGTTRRPGPGGERPRLAVRAEFRQPAAWQRARALEPVGRCALPAYGLPRTPPSFSPDRAPATRSRLDGTTLGGEVGRGSTQAGCAPWNQQRRGSGYGGFGYSGVRQRKWSYGALGALQPPAPWSPRYFRTEESRLPGPYGNRAYDCDTPGAARSALTGPQLDFGRFERANEIHGRTPPAVSTRPEMKEQYLLQIRICFNSKEKAIDCPRTSEHIAHECDKWEDVKYPSVPPTYYYLMKSWVI